MEEVGYCWWADSDHAHRAASCVVAEGQQEKGCKTVTDTLQKKKSQIVGTESCIFLTPKLMDRLNQLWDQPLQLNSADGTWHRRNGVIH